MVWTTRILLVCVVVSLFGCGGTTGVDIPKNPAPPPKEKPAALASPASPSVD